MRLRGLDLNHLVTLETLLTERNLTRAADRHQLTQPAISNALTKLRDYFEDQLLVRNGRDMERTPFAEQILPSLRTAIAHMQAVAQAKPKFDPKTVVRDVRIVTSDYVAQVLLPDTIRHFNAECPNVSLVHVALSDHAIADFEKGDLDAMIVPVGPAFCEKFPYRELYSERWVCIARQGNSAVGNSLTASEYYQLPHVGPSYKQYIIARTWPPPNDIVARAAAHLPFSAIPRLIAETDYVAVIPERLAQMNEQQLKLRRVELLPAPMAVKFALFWHPEGSMDAFLMWMLDQMVEVGARLGS